MSGRYIRSIWPAGGINTKRISVLEDTNHDSCLLTCRVNSTLLEISTHRSTTNTRSAVRICQRLSGIAFGWPPSSVVSLRFGAQDNSQERSRQSGIGVKQPKYSQIRLTEKPVVGSLICCKRGAQLNGATMLGKCSEQRDMKPELNQFHWKLGSEEYYKSIVKSACGSN